MNNPTFTPQPVPDPAIATADIRLSRLPGLRNQTIEALLLKMPEWGASDLHISPDGMHMRIAGELRKFSDFNMDDLSVKETLAGWLRPVQKEDFDRSRFIDFSFSVAQERFRGHADYDVSGTNIVLRHIPTKPVGIEDLRMQDSVKGVLEGLSARRSGLILVTGSTGSGKSTTLAAVIRNILKKRSANIITLEKPIEFNLKNVPDMIGRIQQREVGLHVPDFKSGIEDAMRSDPDVIMVGEIRRPEELQAALAAAETGHLVLATLHTRGAVGALSRIIDMCDSADKALVRTQLSDCLRGVVYQALVPLERDPDQRMAACEVLLDTPGVRSLIRKDNFQQLDSLMQAGAGIGMARFDDVLGNLCREGLISVETAVAFANSPDELHKSLGTGKLRLA